MITDRVVVELIQPSDPDSCCEHRGKDDQGAPCRCIEQAVRRVSELDDGEEGGQVGLYCLPHAGEALIEAIR